LESARLLLSRDAFHCLRLWPKLDADGIVTRLLLLEFGTLVAGKTKILQFDLAGQPCGSISRIVVNDTAACTLSDGGGESDFCATRLEAASRTAIQFGL